MPRYAQQKGPAERRDLFSLSPRSLEAVDLHYEDVAIARIVLSTTREDRNKLFTISNIVGVTRVCHAKLPSFDARKHKQLNRLSESRFDRWCFERKGCQPDYVSSSRSRGRTAGSKCVGANVF